MKEERIKARTRAEAIEALRLIGCRRGEVWLCWRTAEMEAVHSRVIVTSGGVVEQDRREAEGDFELGLWYAPADSEAEWDSSVAVCLVANMLRLWLEVEDGVFK